MVKITLNLRVGTGTGAGTVGIQFGTRNRSLAKMARFPNTAWNHGDPQSNENSLSSRFLLGVESRKCHYFQRAKQNIKFLKHLKD
jgi:hypothetical protein